jgi:hypothetical protein
MWRAPLYKHIFLGVACHEIKYDKEIEKGVHRFRLRLAILLTFSSSTIFQTSIYRGTRKKQQKWQAKFRERTIVCHTELEAALMFDGWVREDKGS